MPAEKKRRWTSKEDEVLVRLFKSQKVDSNIASKEYIQKVQSDNATQFGFCRPETFTKHYNKNLHNYRIAQHLEGSRSKFIF